MKTVKEKGVVFTKKLLKQGLDEGYETNDRLTMSIVTNICKQYQISESELFIGSSRKQGRRVGAKMTLVYLLKERLEFSQAQISRKLRLNKSTTSKYIHIMNDLNIKIPEHKKLQNNLAIINQKIDEYVESNKL
jgi:predicted XRE-type DNA-binding protein